MSDSIGIGYIIGSSVVLTVGVVIPDSQTPAQADTVVLDGLVLADGATTHEPLSQNFALETTGVWTLTLDTTGMDAGEWTWRAIATTSNGTRAIQEDTFVLRVPFGPSL